MRPCPAGTGGHEVRASKDLTALLNSVICHSDEQAMALCYQMLLRHQQDPRAAQNPADRLTHQLHAMDKSVRRDIHKMHAFCAFGNCPAPGSRAAFAAWFELQHFITERAATFFAEAFPATWIGRS